MRKYALNADDCIVSFQVLGSEWQKMKSNAVILFGERVRRKNAEDALILREVETAEDGSAAWAFFSQIVDFNNFASRYIEFGRTGHHDYLLSPDDLSAVTKDMAFLNLQSMFDGSTGVAISVTDLANFIYCRSPATYEFDPLTGVYYVSNNYANFKPIDKRHTNLD